VIAGHQPFSVPALALLRDLLMDESQQRLTALTKEKARAQGGEAAAPSADEQPVAEAPPAGTPQPPPTNAGGIGLTGGLFIDGVEYDPITLKRQQEAQREASNLVYVAWTFTGRDDSVLTTLQAIDGAVRTALNDVAAAGGLAITTD